MINKILLTLLSLPLATPAMADSVMVCKGVEEKKLDAIYLAQNSTKMEDYLRKYTFPSDHYENHRLKRITEADKVILISENSDGLLPLTTNGLVSTIALSYGQHIPIKIRPDDVWLNITSNFAQFVNKNSALLASVFVNHTGRKPLSSFLETGSITSGADWDYFINDWAQQIKKDTKANVYEWVVPDFSTSTPKDVTIGKLVLQSSLQSYYTFHGGAACGVPKITLTGTLQDWQKIRERIQWLETLPNKDLKDWGAKLGTVADEFIKTFKTGNNPDFWQQALDPNEEGYGDTVISGWLILFAPFDRDGKYVINKKASLLNSLPFSEVEFAEVADGMVSFPVEFCDKGKAYDVQLWAGALYPSYDSKSNELSTMHGWSVISKDHEKVRPPCKPR